VPNDITAVEPVRGATVPATIIDSAERIAESYADYLTDESGYGPPSADRLVLAGDEAEVSHVLVDAASRGDPVTVSAGRTGIAGGAVPLGGTLLSVSMMQRILGVRRLPDGRWALRAEPGISIADLGERIRTRDLSIDASTLLDDGTRDLEAFGADQTSWFYPPDPTEDAAHLGATVATNASGARTFRYGATRAHVNGIRVALTTGGVLAVERGAVTADGRAFTVRRLDGSAAEVVVPSYEMPATKNAAGLFAARGMDLIDLFIGSEGTLGVVTEIEIVLSPRPAGILSALAFLPTDADAIALVRHARGDLADAPRPGAVDPIALELFDSRSLDFLRTRKNDEGAASQIPELPGDAGAGVLFEQDFADEDALMEVYEGWEELLAAHGSSMEQTWGGMEEADLEPLRALRHSLPEQVNGTIARTKAAHPEIHKIGTDIAVPAESLEEMLGVYREGFDGTGLEYVVFGHVGDSHLHVNILPRSPDELRRGKELALRFAEHAVGLGGTVSGEHGIGKLKHDFLRILYGDSGLAEMAAVKKALDPACVLNRGVMFPEELL
jgi:D-lactate dehydrogenase (cytochrome)